MSVALKLPEGFWYKEETNEKPLLTIGMEEAVKNITGAFIELKVPEEGTLLESGDPIISIVGTDQDTEISLPFKSVIVEVNTTLVDLQNITERDWLLKIELL